jgi:HEPN domain-containing protein
MKPIASEWVERAEEDYRVAEREQGAWPPAYNAVCFHAQQCAEKYLKALLQEYEIPFPKTHDLEALMRLCLPVMPQLEAHRDALLWLTTFAVEVRYPGVNAGKADAEHCVQIAAALRDSIRGRLGL